MYIGFIIIVFLQSKREIHTHTNVEGQSKPPLNFIKKKRKIIKKKEEKIRIQSQ